MKELFGFDRVTLAPGERRTVTVTLPGRELAYWDTGRNSFYVEAGSFEVMAGSSSAEIRLTAALNASGGVPSIGSPAPTASPTAAPTGTLNLGDVNGNGTVDIIDALLAAQYYVGLNPSPFEAAKADVNCNGTIDIVDALLIAQYYVGLVSQFC